MKMENKKDKVKLNDDLLDKVSGGGENGKDAVWGDGCMYCGKSDKLSITQIEGGLVTYYCDACKQTYTLFDQG